MTVQEFFSKLFPTWQVVLMTLGWVGVSAMVSSLFNNQELANKKLNALKTFLYTLFIGSWAIVAGYYVTGEVSFVFFYFLLVVWVLFLVGDWIAYLIHKMHSSPGGTQGWFWFTLAKLHKNWQQKAMDRGLKSLRPTERALYEKEKAEHSAALLKELVENVPDARVIVAPPLITAAFPAVKQLAITPVMLVSTLPETPLIVPLMPKVPQAKAT